MTKYMQSATKFTLADDAAVTVHNSLPAGTYAVEMNEHTGQYYLKQVDDFKIGKIYGDTTKHADRIYTTFEKRPNSTGVLLVGEKGSGKTLLARILSVKAYEKGVPTILINQPWCGEKFNLFIASINQPCVVIFDEYEKTYSRDQQEAMLTLLDGVYPTNKLFILTSNNKYAVDTHMINRPGRLFYQIEYKGVSEDFVREYCADNLDNKANVEGLVKLSTIFEKFNFDMLKAVVEEMNRYNETAQEAIDIMNIRAEGYTEEYDVIVSNAGGVLKEERQHINPLQKFRVSYFVKGASKNKLSVVNGTDIEFEEDDESNGHWVTINLDPGYIVAINNGTYTFKVGDVTVVCKHKPISTADLRHLAS